MSYTLFPIFLFFQCIKIYHYHFKLEFSTRAFIYPISFLLIFLLVTCINTSYFFYSHALKFISHSCQFVYFAYAFIYLSFFSSRYIYFHISVFPIFLKFILFACINTSYFFSSHASKLWSY